MKIKWVVFYVLDGHKMYVKEFNGVGNNHHTETKRHAQYFNTEQANKIIADGIYQKERVLKSEMEL